MTIQDIITARQITSIFHFTTSNGLLGMLADSTPQLLPRSRLTTEQHLEYILEYNSHNRPDTDWFGYSSLSISAVNYYFFQCSLRKHPDAFWAILEFSEEILTHEGVYFATTNNIYSEVVRGQGAEGLEALFAPRVKNAKCIRGYIERTSLHRPHHPTDKQAEVLYPGPLSFDHLKTILVKDEACFNLVKGQLRACCCNYEVKIAPEHFEHE